MFVIMLMKDFVHYKSDFMAKKTIETFFSKRNYLKFKITFTHIHTIYNKNRKLNFRLCTYLV